MSFEDDAYWESEYTDRSTARKAVRRQAPPPVDELAARRRRRHGRYRRPPRRDGGVQKGFDTERPDWLDDPDFVPTDVSAPDAADPDSAVLDFNRPELGAFDTPTGPWTGHDIARVEDDDWDDEIDEPYDHRAGMDRRSAVPGLGGYVPAREDWDDPSPEDWDDLDEPYAAVYDDAPDRYRRATQRHDAADDRPDDPPARGRAAPPPRIVRQAGPPPAPKQAEPVAAPRILSGPPRVTPKPIAPAAIESAPAHGEGPAGRVSPTGAAAMSPPSAGAAPVSLPAVGTAPVSPASMATAPVSPAAAAPASGPPAAAVTTPVPARPGGVLPPAQWAPGDTAAPPGKPTADDGPAGTERASTWFVAKPRTPAASEVAAPDTSSDEGQVAGKPAAPVLAPEHLRAVRWRLDGATLREVVDDPDALRDLGSRLDGPLAAETDHVARAGLLSLRAEVYRLLGELGMAAAASRLALAHAESARDVHAIVIAQAELAHVLRLGGHYAEADSLLEEAAGSEAPELLRSVVHEYAGRSCFDQGRHMEALNHFARAIRLGAPDDLDLVERIDVCLEAVYIHVLRDGWGPYPRLRREILAAP